MKKRRGRDEGSIYKRKDGRWVAVYTVEGKKRYIYAKTRKEAARRLNQAIADRDAGLVYDSENLTVAKYLERWLASVKPTVKHSTYRRYEEASRLHIAPALGRYKLSRLSPTQLQNLYLLKLQSLSPRSVQIIHRTIYKALKQAVRWSPSSEKYKWIIPDAKPRELHTSELRRAVARVAVSSLIAKHLPDGGRHDVALAYAGLMLRPLMELGEETDDAIEYVQQTLQPAWEYHDAPEEAFEDLCNCIKDTAQKIEADEPATGAPTLEELLEHGKAISKKIKDWLGWGELTPEQREEIEYRKRVKRAQKAWSDERVRKLAQDPNILSRVYETMQDGGS